MRLSAAEKEEIIRLVDGSELGVNQTLRQLGIHKSTFYKWYKACGEKGLSGLDAKTRSSRQWNEIPEAQKQLVVEVALEHTALSPGNWPQRSPMNRGFLSPNAVCTAS